MKKHFLLTKTLLVALLCLVGQSVWATVTPVSQDYSSGTADWTSGNTGRYTVDMNAGGYLTVNAVSNGNNGATITGSTVNGKAAAGDDFESSDDFTLLFDLQLTGGNGQPSWFHINDASNNCGGEEAVGTHMLTLQQTAANGTTWRINGATDKTVTMSKSTWYTFQLSKKGSLLYLTVTPTAGGAPVFAQQQITVNSLKGGLGNMIFQTKRYYAFMAIDNVVLRAWQSGDTPAGVPTTYTIKYENETGVKIADDVQANGLVGDEVTASAAQMAPVTYNAQKYIYKSGNKDLTLVATAASNVITLVYREAETYSYKVTSSIGTVLVNSSDFEGETVTVPYPKYELDGTDLKEAAKSGGTAWYAKSYTLDADLDETITYSNAATPIENVVFYIEGENITGATVSTSNNANIRNSNAAVGYAAGTAGADDLTITTLAPGKYKIVANVHTSSSSGGTTTFILGANNFAAVGTASQYNTEKTSDEFTIYENTDLVLQAGGGAQNAVDYVYVIKTGSATVPATLGSNGYATFASPYALDLTTANLPSGVTAYKASVSGTTVTFTALNQTVPANTGVLLRGTTGTVNIPVAATGTAVEGNAFLVNNGGAKFTGDDSYYYFGLLKDSNPLTFRKFVPSTTAIPADKAYLKVSKSSLGSSARGLEFVFDDEVTGVNEVRVKNLTPALSQGEGAWFDLQGRKVAQPQKGLYIVNGKKVVLK